MSDAPGGLVIGDSDASDWAALEALYPDAFPDEDLSPLVRGLLRDEAVDCSLVARRGDQIVGHIVFTRGRAGGCDAPVALLGPLAVATRAQRSGVGSALVLEGLKRLTAAGFAQAYVLGDPDYYRRFGFAPETDVNPPYPLPDAWRGAWRSLTLGDAEGRPRGALRLPEIWMEPAYWGP